MAPSTALLVTSILTALLAILVGGIYMSGAADDLIEWATTKFLVYKAKGEEKALEKAGSEGAENFLKGQLKHNPVVSDDELNRVSGGLGGEAGREFGALGKNLG